MVKIKLEQNKKKKLLFKIKLDEKSRGNIFFKRAIMEGKKLKKSEEYQYEIPLRFFVPICSNLKREDFEIDKTSVLSYLEFSDEYDENYFNELEADGKYMKKWREEGCPEIYKISINAETKDVKKEISFKKLKGVLSGSIRSWNVNAVKQL